MEWQDISTAPKDGTSILLFVDESVIEGFFDSDRDRLGWEFVWLSCHGCGCCGQYDDEPTHWMPLPEAPKL